MFTPEEARKLATQVVKDNKVARVKFGTTNGRHCIHVIVDKRSTTLYDAWEWSYHEWNERERKREKRKKDVIEEGVRAYSIKGGAR